MRQGHNIRSQRYKQRLTQEFVSQRDELGQMTPELVLIFADGQVGILEHVAAGLASETGREAHRMFERDAVGNAGEPRGLGHRILGP